MTAVKRLQQLSKLASAADKTNVHSASRHERLIKSVFGNLGIERRSLKIERVRQVLSENRTR